MLKEFVEKILELGKLELPVIGERTYSTHELCKIEAPTPTPLGFHTLDGFIAYLHENKDALDKAALMIGVVDENQVFLYEKLEPMWKRRSIYSGAHFNSRDHRFEFGQFMDAETFVIQLLSKFVQDESTKAVLSIVGNMTTENINTSADDGVTQTVSARAGVTLQKQKEIPNPITLRPYRTFLELEQPASAFLLRVRQSREGQIPQVALFEADGGKWKLDAIKKIRAYLAVAITDVPVIA